MDWTLILILCAAILCVAILRGAQSMRHTKDTERGSLPGKGDHVIHADYSSGAGGGGHSTTYTIPRDPQDYAKRFVPRSAKASDSSETPQQGQQT